MNSCNFTGNIGGDLELKELDNDKCLLNLSIAVRGRGDEPVWVDLTLWNQSARFVAKYGTKGQLLIASNCTYKVNKWQDKDGNTRRRGEFHCHQVELGPRKEKDAGF